MRPVSRVREPIADTATWGYLTPFSLLERDPAPTTVAEVVQKAKRDGRYLAVLRLGILGLERTIKRTHPSDGTTGRSTWRRRWER